VTTNTYDVFFEGGVEWKLRLELIRLRGHEFTEGSIQLLSILHLKGFLYLGGLLRLRRLE
jgi:hypothetical protein